MLKKIISGGQTGADQGGLIFCKKPWSRNRGMDT